MSWREQGILISAVIAAVILQSLVSEWIETELSFAVLLAALFIIATNFIVNAIRGRI